MRVTVALPVYCDIYKSDHLLKSKIILPKYIEILLLVVMVFQAFFSNTILDLAQIISELILIVAGCLLIVSYIRLDKEDLSLLIIFVVTQSFSFATNDLHVFLLNFKIYILAVVFVIVAKSITFRSNIINVVGALSIVLVVLEYFVFEGYPFDVTSFIKHKDFVNERPIGVFLNYHFTAFFIAVYLIGKSYRYNLFFIDYFLIFITGVRTSIYSYFVQQLLFKKNKKKFVGNGVAKDIFVVFVMLSVGIVFLDTIMSVVSEYDPKYSSFKVIMKQLMSYDFILTHLVLTPVDVDKYIVDYVMNFDEFGYADIGNETALLTYIMQGGIVLFLYYLYLLFKYISVMRIFVLMSLVHYSFITVPFIIMVMFHSQEEYTREHLKYSLV